MKLSDITFQEPRLFWIAGIAIPLAIVFSLISRADQHRAGKVVSACLRVLVIALLVTALSRPELKHVSTETVQPTVCILLDRSESTESDRQSIDQIGESLEAMLSGLPTIVGSFAGDVVRGSGQPIHPNGTDLEAAIQTGVGWSQAKGGGRLILVTDANATRGSAVEAAQRAVASGANVMVVPVGKKVIRGPRIREIEPPNNVHVGISARMSITIDSDAPRRVRLEFLDAAGRLVATRQMSVDGDQTTTLPFTAGQPGSQELELRVIDETDPMNRRLADSRRFPTFAAGPPSILVCDAAPGEVVALVKALDPLKLPVESCTPDTLPNDLGKFSAIILSDLNGRELTSEQQAQIRQFSESNGGGLMFLGGKNVNASRWQKASLSDLLPVTLKEKPAKVIAKMPDVSVCFVLDRSGSMQETLGAAGGHPVRKLDMVKAAVKACVQALPDTATICVVVFDSQADVAVDPVSVAQRGQISAKVDAIDLGGGTSMGDGLDAGMRILNQMNGAKYLIVLTDGQSIDPPAGRTWESIADQARAAGMSWTSIAVGRDADQQLLAGMAARAGGKYTFCGDASELPKIFIDEAKAIKRVADKQDEPVLPRRGPQSFVLRGKWLDSMPVLTGAVSADAKAGADVELMTGTHEPILASWQFGAGRVAVHLGGAKTNWAGNWIQWSEFSSAWVEMVQLVLRPPNDLHVRTSTRCTGDTATIALDVKDANGNAVPDAKVEILSDGSTQRVVATTRRPGQYFAEVPKKAGADILRLHAIVRRGNVSEVHYVTDVSFRESLEGLKTGVNLDAAQSIAKVGDGVCTTDLAEIEAICREQIKHTVEDFRPVWPWLLFAAILCWPVDVLIRKLL